MSKLSRLAQDAAHQLAALAAVAFSHLVVQTAAPLELAAGLFVIFIIAMIGYAVARVAPWRFPDIFWVSMTAVVMTAPILPGAALLKQALDGLDLASTMVPIMVFAGLGLRQEEVQLFRKSGPAFAVVSLLVFTGVFLGCAFVAHVVLNVAPSRPI